MLFDLFAENSVKYYQVRDVLVLEQAHLMFQIRHARHGNHRLRHSFGEWPKPRPQPAGENHGLHAGSAPAPAASFIAASVVRIALDTASAELWRGFQARPVVGRTTRKK